MQSLFYLLKSISHIIQPRLNQFAKHPQTLCTINSPVSISIFLTYTKEHSEHHTYIWSVFDGYAYQDGAGDDGLGVFHFFRELDFGG